MTTSTNETEYLIDAADRSLGRVASEAAVALRGKNSPSFKPYLNPGIKVKIINAGKLKLEYGKADKKVYWRHSGYPGSERTETLGKRLDRQGPSEIVKTAVRGMLPSNRLRSELLKQLTVEA